MTNEEYIRKAVELADGFSYYEDTEQYFGPIGSGLQWPSQQYLDALAAQLVRQVRQVAAERKQPWLWTNMRRAVMGASLRDDLTMNTIKAIVDSRVLEQSDE